MNAIKLTFETVARPTVNRLQCERQLGAGSNLSPADIDAAWRPLRPSF